MPDHFPYRTEYLDGFSLCGLSVQITKSQSANAEICKRFWKELNQALAANQLAQGRHWQKFAITYNDSKGYRYFCGIPVSPVIPNSFQTMAVPACHYLVFEHRGSTRGIAKTLSEIYRNFLPNSEHKHERSKLFHFEKYDHKFRWNHAESLIEIWLPISLAEQHAS
jgi:AraC family transcriptional regulator